MSALHSGNVAEREYDGGEAAVYGGGMGSGDILPFHHIRRHRFAHFICGAGMANLVLPLQRPGRVSDFSLNGRNVVNIIDCRVSVYL